ncbi:MAG: hypothetical protein CMJ41_11030 [Phycisphaerae bacterium]|mgnify:CR=1 FL=1|nr:hypothetical protein [Phycisphaerae bacterium]|tara:strand:- start:2395 stop:2823 length:429 start_codon:yes stop_codon:yes gene_type:complete
MNYKKYVPSKKAVLISLFVVCLLGISFGVYMWYVRKPSYIANKEFSLDKDSAFVHLYFFYTSWCPHCKTAFPIWNKLKDEVKTVNGKQINYFEVDCEKDTETAEKFAVEGYPTIKLVDGKKIIEYDAKPDLDTLNEFLSTSI